jgi:hypothetical protein
MAKSLNTFLGVAFLLLCACGGSGDSQSTPNRAQGTPKKARPVASIDICSLLTQSEAEEILGKKLQPPQRQSGGDCWYGSQPGNPDVILSFLPVYPRSRSDFDAFIAKEVADLNAKMKKLGAKESTIEPVRELSEPAYYVDPSLFVFRNNRVLGIFAERPQAIAIATKAIPRWKG